MNIEFVKEEHEAQAFDGENKAGFCQYQEKGDNTWEIIHTVVDSNYQGQGLAGKLLDEVCRSALKEGVKIIPTCSYAVKKFDQEVDKYGDLDAR